MAPDISPITPLRIPALVPIAASLLLLAGIAAKATLVPGTGILFTGVLLVAAGLFMYCTGAVINDKQTAGIPKLLQAMLWLCCMLGTWSLAQNLGQNQPVANYALICQLGWIAYASTLRNKSFAIGKSQLLWAFPMVALLALGGLLIPAQVKYTTFNPASPYVPWADYTRGYHLSGGYLIDSAGVKVRPVPYMR